MARPPLATAVLLAALGLPAMAAEPVKLEPGKPLDLVCETRAVSVADEAQATTGSVRIRLEAAAQPPASAEAAVPPPSAGEGDKSQGTKSESSKPEGDKAGIDKPGTDKPEGDKAQAAGEQPKGEGIAAGPSGRWSIADVPAGHVASFALKQREACAAAPCPFEPGPKADTLHLWAPSKIMPDKLAAGSSMSLGALDLAGLTLRVSTFRDGAIAALEQGDCKPAP